MSARPTRYRSWRIAGVIVSIAWLAAVAYYATTQIGWANLAYLLPHELAAFVLGAAVPPAVLILGLAYAAMRAELGDAAQVLEARLDLLIYPPSEARLEVESVAQALERHAETLADVSEAAANRAESRMRQAARDIEARINEAGLAVDGAAETAARRMETMAGILAARGAELDAASDRAERINEAIDRQARELSAAANEANSAAAAVRRTTLDAVREGFLRDSKQVVDELGALGVDVMRLIERPVPEKLWRQFSRGDRNVFLRSLLGNGEARRIQDEIRAHYDSDPEFRKCADRYLDSFAELLEQADRSDPANLLSSAFVTSDVGKVYVLLSRAVGRMN
ncbi:MAG: hypothetical protein OEO83_05865 [Alphaproteobacteria bacterium]|nr:hypothetical protein [Alphaproteobacteria bacterium]